MCFILFTFIHIYIHSLFIYLFVYSIIWVYLCHYSCIHTNVHTHSHGHIHNDMYKCACVRAYACKCWRTHAKMTAVYRYLENQHYTICLLHDHRPGSLVIAGGWLLALQCPVGSIGEVRMIRDQRINSLRIAVDQKRIPGAYRMSDHSILSPTGKSHPAKLRSSWPVPWATSRCTGSFGAIRKPWVPKLG